MFCYTYKIYLTVIYNYIILLPNTVYKKTISEFDLAKGLLLWPKYYLGVIFCQILLLDV